MQTQPSAALRAVGAFGRFLIVLGLAVMLFVAYQLWGTSVQEAQAQSELEDEFEALLLQVSAPPSTTSLAPATTEPASPTTTAPGARSTTTTAPQTDERQARLATLPDEVIEAALSPEQGEVTVRLDIDTIDISKFVVEGVQVADLRKGPGHYRASPQPGLAGNTGIAGHRTTYGQPFHDIDALNPGDQITVVSLLGTFVYEVMAPQDAYRDRLDDVDATGPGHIIVDPSATWVLDDFGDNRLTLTACHPKLSARQRIVVAARLIGEPVDPGAVVDLAALAPVDDVGVEPSDPAATVVPADDAATVEDGSAPASRAELIDEVTLDEGLDGEGQALVPAVVWGLVVTLVYLLVARAFRTGSRLAAIGFGAAPLLIALWLCFQQVDRLLPAY